MDRSGVVQTGILKKDKRARKRKRSWLGPVVVLCQERGRAQGSRDLPEIFVWIVVMDMLLRLASEHLRPISERDDRHMMCTQTFRKVRFGISDSSANLLMKTSHHCTVKCSPLPILQNSCATVDVRSARCKVTVPRKRQRKRQKTTGPDDMITTKTHETTPTPTVPTEPAETQRSPT